jgi:hypothetical protein
MISKSTYAIQPYHVGRKDRKSLAVIIPAKVAKEFNVNTSTIFAIQTDKQNKILTLRMIETSYERNIMTPAGRTLNSFSQQVSTASTQ